MATQQSLSPGGEHHQTPKRLIVCCDGTWQAGDHVSKGDSSYQTNITRMCHALADDGLMPNGNRIPQVIYYQSGVGSNVPTALGKMIAGGIGYGVNENILAAYNFLVNNYTVGDEIFLFGFSRGSFTCRSLAGMISKFGILKQEEAGEWFAGIWDRYQGTVKDQQWDKERDHLTWDVTIKVMGCWDTVGSLGIPESGFTKIFNLNKKYAFHDTELSDKIENAFHALALDEHRKSFSPTLWYIPPEQPRESRTRLSQCWFPGVHTDVGRGYDDHVPGDVADLTFVWMVDQCRDFLSFNERMLRRLLEKGDFKQPVGEQAERQREERVRKGQSWGLADVHDSMSSLLFKLGGSTIRSPGRYIFKKARHATQVKASTASDRSPSGSSFVTKSKILNQTLASKPWFSHLLSAVQSMISSPPDPLVPVWTSESIHPSVRVRMIKDPTYDPPSLRGFKLMYDSTRNRWTWAKEWTAADGVIRQKRLHEYRIGDPSLARGTVTTETLETGLGHEVPLPPRQKRSWFQFW